MNAQQLHKLTKQVSDWKILLGVGAIVVTTIFNLGSSFFSYALITKLEPINKKVSAIEESGVQRDSTFNDFKTAYDRQYGGLIDKIDSVSNKIDRLTLRLIGVKF